MKPRITINLKRIAAKSMKPRSTSVWVDKFNDARSSAAAVGGDATSRPAS